MSHTFAVCKPSGVPQISTCTNYNSNGMTSSINASFGQFRYSKTSTSDNLGACVPISIRGVPIGNVCAGVQLSNGDINPFLSFGAKIGNTGYQYKPDITDIYHQLFDKTTTTVFNNGSIVTANGDAVSTMTLGPINDLLIHDPAKLDASHISKILDKCNTTISSLQEKTQQIMDSRGIKAETIGVIMDRTPLREPVTAQLQQYTEFKQITTTVNEIITSVTSTPNFNMFDILDRINQASIDKTKLLAIIEEHNKDTRKWHIDRSRGGRMGTLFPCCCDDGLGWDIEWHIVHKVDYCRYCFTKFPLECFISIN